MDVLPIFYDHSSQKALLTWWAEEDCKPTGPQSILSVCKQEGLKKVVFVSKNFSTFLEAWKICKANKIQLIFGVELRMCDDARTRNAESIYNEHKAIIFARNSKGYQDLLKVYSQCHSNPENKYYVQRFDYKQLAEVWTPNLHLAIPFFDGFIARNTIGFNTNIVPDISFCKNQTVIMREVKTEHPFEMVINPALEKYSNYTGIPIENTKTIYYKTREDFLQYSVYRSIQNQQPFVNPNIEFFCSSAFCVEVWKELKS